MHVYMITVGPFSQISKIRARLQTDSETQSADNNTTSLLQRE